MRTSTPDYARFCTVRAISDHYRTRKYTGALEKYWERHLEDSTQMCPPHGATYHEKAIYLHFSLDGEAKYFYDDNNQDVLWLLLVDAFTNRFFPI